MPTAGGEPRRVTDHPLGAGAPAWSPDSRQIAYVARVPEEGRYSGKSDAEPPRRITTLKYREDGIGFFIDRRPHVFVVDPFGAEPQPIQVTSGDFDNESVAWSPDGQLAFVSARHDDRERDIVSDVWLCAADGSQLRPVTRGGPSDGPRLSISSVSCTPDGASICFAATDHGPDGLMMTGHNENIWSVPADGSAAPTRLTDAETVNVARDTSILATPDGVLACVEHRGAVELLLVSYDNHDQPQSLVGGHRQVEGFARTDSTLIVVAADPASRGELIAVDLSVADGGTTPRTPREDRTEHQLTTLAAVPARPMEEITTQAPDGYPVHGWIVRPEGPGPHPVLLMIHGGPATQYGWRLFDESQVYAGAGYAVILGNPRGSSGYGQAHGTSIFGDAATIAAADLLALLDAGLATGGLDSSRVGVLGGSYGG